MESSNLLQRAFLYLEDGEFNKANEYAERVLDEDCECAEAYLVKTCCDLHLTDRTRLSSQVVALGGNKNFQKALRFASGELKSQLEACLAAVSENKRSFDKSLEKKKYIAGMIAADDDSTVAVRADGRAIGTGYNLWHELDFHFDDIVSLIMSGGRAVCLRGNGEVVSTGGILAPMSAVEHSHCNGVFGARGCVITTSRYDNHIQFDGTHSAVVKLLGTTGDIIGAAAGYGHIVMLNKDGTVFGAGSNGEKQMEVSWWKNITAVACGNSHTVGLKSDGTVVATGSNSRGQCDVSQWRDIIAIACGGYHTLGLKSDGTVVATGINNQRQSEVFGWRDIVAITCGEFHSVGVRADGTVVATGRNNHGQCNVEGWKLFRSYETVWEERGEALRREQANLQAAYATAKGLFAGSKKKKIQERLDEIEKEIKEL